MKRIMLLFVLVSASAFGQSLHVTAVRQWQPTDAPRVTRSFETFVVEGLFGGKRYQLQQLKVWGAAVVRVGQDYPVLKVEDRALIVETVDKKGRKDHYRLDVTGVSE